MFKTIIEWEFRRLQGNFLSLFKQKETIKVHDLIEILFNPLEPIIKNLKVLDEKTNAKKLILKIQNLFYITKALMSLSTEQELFLTLISFNRNELDQFKKRLSEFKRIINFLLRKSEFKDKESLKHILIQFKIIDQIFTQYVIKEEELKKINNKENSNLPTNFAEETQVRNQIQNLSKSIKNTFDSLYEKYNLEFSKLLHDTIAENYKVTERYCWNVSGGLKQLKDERTRDYYIEKINKLLPCLEYISTIPELESRKELITEIISFFDEIINPKTANDNISNENLKQIENYIGILNDLLFKLKLKHNDLSYGIELPRHSTINSLREVK